MSVAFLLLFIGFAAVHCFSLPVVALFGFSLLLCQPPSIGPELKQVNENGNEKWSLLLFVARFGFGGMFPFAVRCFLLLFVAAPSC